MGYLTVLTKSVKNGVIQQFNVQLRENQSLGVMT
jgi:hypothetical protein